MSWKMKERTEGELFIDEKFLSKTTQELIRIKAVNSPPALTDYTELVNYLTGHLKCWGFSVMIAGKEHYPNIIGRRKGTGESTKCIMLNAHMDTVPAGDVKRWNGEPFAGKLENGYVYGRGACDMRGQIAMILAVAKAIDDNGIEPAGELAVSFVSGHETGSINGSVHLVENSPEVLRADLCFIPEPTNFKISVASRGIYWLKAKTRGLNGHTATFNEVWADGTVVKPVNAIHKMNKFINYLLDVDDWMNYQPNAFTGEEYGMYSAKPIVEVNLISGGEKQINFDDVFPEFEIKKVFSTGKGYQERMLSFTRGNRKYDLVGTVLPVSVGDMCTSVVGVIQDYSNLKRSMHKVFKNDGNYYTFTHFLKDTDRGV